ncbi:hypothetical protein P9199_10265 [Geobacillus stearothermophilus]|uniref:hypothetical protein n=1 Tax=Geobacillus stearothermophilus TaxID=1422 RepID=UPI002E1FF056|nr:hypothetical protein [Geobacillus stearothermophilus]
MKGVAPVQPMILPSFRKTDRTYDRAADGSVPLTVQRRPPLLGGTALIPPRCGDMPNLNQFIAIIQHFFAKAANFRHISPKQRFQIKDYHNAMRIIKCQSLFLKGFNDFSPVKDP